MSDPQDLIPKNAEPTRPDASPAPGSGPDAAEDAGTQALSEALRSSFVIIRLIMLGLVLVFLLSNCRTVEPQEKAVILRFGKPAGTGEEALLDPGAHLAFPYPVDEIVRIPIGQIQSVPSTIGWYATSAALEAAGNEPPAGRSLDPARDGYLLTADENIIHVRGFLRYRIREPGLRYTFGLAQSSNLVLNAFNNALIFAAAHYKVDDLLTRDVAGFREKVRARLDQLIGLHDLGITVDQIELQAIPPRQLTEKFAAVLESEINRTKLINDAKSYTNKTVSVAKAEAAAIQSNGETERKRLVDFVATEAKRFTELLPAYERNRDLFMRQHQTEVLQRVLTNAQEKILVPSRAGRGPYQLRLQLSRAPEKPTIAPPPPPDDHH